MQNGGIDRWQTDFGKWVSNFGVCRLAISLDINRQAIYHWIGGRTFPSLSNAKKIIILSDNHLSMQKIYSHAEAIK